MTLRVAICSVGSELAGGDVVDTNAAWLARRVRESGGDVVALLVVGDDRVGMRDAFTWLADRADVVVVGGGLGPTADDLTREVIAEVAGVELTRREELVEHVRAIYARLGRPVPERAWTQADLPATARHHPPAGSAAGFTLDVEVAGRTVTWHVLPGVPWEYRTTADAEVLPDLVRRGPGRARTTRVLHVAGLGESAVGDLLGELASELAVAAADPAHPRHGIELAFLANGDEVLVKVIATGASPRAARERAEPIVDLAARRLGSAVSSVDERRLEDEVGALLRTGGRTVAVAETVTGGRLASALSAPEGAWRWFRGGSIVDGATLGTVSDLEPVSGTGPPVSVEVASALADGVRERFGADYGVAVTVAADADRTPADGDVGAAVWAVVGPDGSAHVDERAIPSADRSTLQVRAAAFALEALRHRLVADGDPSRPVGTVAP